jgi:Rad3-related DNA helicase
MNTAMELIRDTLPTGVIETICSARVENYLVYFPAYAYLATMLGLLKERLPERQLLVQDRAMTESERETFLS